MNDLANQPTPTPTPTPAPGSTPAPGTPPTPTPTPASGNTPPPGETPEAKAARETKEAADKKAADDKAAADKKDLVTKDNPFKAEELKALIPDGVTHDEALQKDFIDIANKHGMSRAAIAELVALQNRTVQGYSDASTKMWQDMQTEWQKTVAADPEIGGDKQQAALAGVHKLVEQFGKDIPTLRQSFDMTGAGNNPDIVKFLARIGKQFSEGAPISGGPGSGAPKSQAEILFPNQGKT